MSVIWDAIVETDIDPDRVSQTPDGVWHVSDDAGLWLVNFCVQEDESGTEWVEVWQEDGSVDSFDYADLDRAIARVAEWSR